MTSVLLGDKQRKELNELLKDPAIFSMVSDLLALGETYQSIRGANNFGILNARYKALTGKDSLRLGAVKEAILGIYPTQNVGDQ